MRVVVTRPAAQAEEWVDALRSLGLAAVALPVFAATQVAPVAAWATLPGIMLVRWLVLRDAGRRRKRATS